MGRCFLVFLFPFFLFLCSCTNSTFCPTTDRIAICNELKSKMIFKGNTSNTRTSDIENSEMAMLQRQYEKYHCDQV